MRRRGFAFTIGPVLLGVGNAPGNWPVAAGTSWLAGLSFHVLFFGGLILGWRR